MAVEDDRHEDGNEVAVHRECGGLMSRTSSRRARRQPRAAAHPDEAMRLRAPQKGPER